MNSAKAQTQAQFIDVARRLFAYRGFHGVSLANIADEVGLTKQALIHHFGNKEKLYGLVLARISTGLTEALDRAEAEAFSPEDRLIRFFSELSEDALADDTDLRLVLREMMDDKLGNEEAGGWYLQPFLKNLVFAFQETRRWRDADEARALTIAYQLLGSLSYFAVSRSSLCHAFGTEYFNLMRQEFVQGFQRSLKVTFEGS